MYRKDHYKDMERFASTKRLYQKRWREKTGSNKYERRYWTEYEDKRVLAQDCTDRELSEEIQRSVLAIQHRRIRLRKGVV